MDKAGYLIVLVLKMYFGIFILYHENLTNNETFSRWTASYNGLGNKLRYHKCRWWFSDFKPNTFEMYGQRFLLEQYGPQYMIPRKYGYFESLKFLPNLIDEH
jgi:hypothetical protein